MATGALVEFVIRVGGIVDFDVMADYIAGFGTTRDNQIAKVLVIFFYRGLAAAHRDSFIEEISHRKRGYPLLRLLILGPRVGRHVYANHSDTARGIDHADAVLQDLGWLFMLGIILSSLA